MATPAESDFSGITQPGDFPAADSGEEVSLSLAKNRSPQPKPTRIRLTQAHGRRNRAHDTRGVDISGKNPDIFLLSPLRFQSSLVLGLDGMDTIITTRVSPQPELTSTSTV